MQSIIAEKREILGKKVKNLRAQGVLPAVVYGKGATAEPISIQEKDFTKLWRSAGESTVVELVIGKSRRKVGTPTSLSEDNDSASGDKKNVLIQDVVFHPIKNTPTHVDFLTVDMNKTIRVEVPLEFIGESEAVKSGGILVKVIHALNIEALPKDLPHVISIDISILKNIEDSIAVKDVTVPAGVKVLNAPEETVVLVSPPRAEEEIKEERTLDSIEVVGKKEKEAEAAAEEAAAAEGAKGK